MSNDLVPIIMLLQDLKGKDSRIHVYLSVTQGGAGNDRNAVLKDAHVRWIAFLDCGDVWTGTNCSGTAGSIT